MPFPPTDAGQGQVLGRATYPAIVRFDAPNNRLELRSQQGPERPFGVFGSDSLSLARSMAVGHDGVLFIADADGTGERGLTLHRLDPGGAVADLRLDPVERRLSYLRAYPAVGPDGEVYVAAATHRFLVENAIVGGTVIPRLLHSQASVQRIDPNGKVRWVWTAGPSSNLVAPQGLIARGGAVRVLLTHRDDLEAAPDAKIPSPEKQPPDSGGFHAITVVSLTPDGRVTALDGMSAQAPCPSWTPNVLAWAQPGSRGITVLSGARDQDKPGVCSRSFGFNGGSVIAFIPAGAGP